MSFTVFETSQTATKNYIFKKINFNSSIDLLTNENIEKTICLAFDDANDLLSGLDVNVVLDKEKELRCIK
jgi:hypothetical protein